MKDDEDLKILGVIIFIAALFVCIGMPFMVKACNRVDYNIQKADDATNYKTLKKVEDTCRAMIASYEADKLTWQQYKDSDEKEKQSWAEQAKMRANKTASTYNNYILENSYIWRDDVPPDIRKQLEYIN